MNGPSLKTCKTPRLLQKWLAIVARNLPDAVTPTEPPAPEKKKAKKKTKREKPEKKDNLGEMRVAGAEVTLHAYVGGYETANLEVGQSIHPINPNHRALIMIGPH